MGAATTSCEDMLEPVNNMVTTDLAPKDTVYQVMGIVKKMQKLVDRTVLLGEVRADLMTANESASLMIKQLADNAVDENNIYNNPADYYDVINSCNIYLANVDENLKTHGEYYYEKEIVSVKAFRAWAYLELAKIYGEVPFVLDPITTANAAEEAVATGERRDLVGICDFLIQDLLPYASLAKNNDLRPSYSAQYNKVSVQKFFIPVRVMLGELYLWRGSFTGNQADFIEASRHYHDFLAFKNEERPTTGIRISWRDFEFTNSPAGVYSSSFTLSSDEVVTVVPMDTSEYYGTYTDLAGLFNSQHKNNYYVALSPSERIREISQAQTYCYLNKNGIRYDTIYAPKDASKLQNEKLYVGDLRLTGVLTENSYNDKYHAEYSKERQRISKYTVESIEEAGDVTIITTKSDGRLESVNLFRLGTIYLHMAEALNRGGFPETAFAVLKYGLSDDILADSTIVSRNEYNRLAQITSPGFQSNLTKWDADYFINIWNNAALGTLSGSTTSMSSIQIGIHSRGCGDSYADATYYLPADSASVDVQAYDEALALRLSEPDATAADTLAYYENRLAVDEHNYTVLQPSRIEAVDKLILDEMALEGMFEGHRFYDLMRYSKFNGKPNFLAERVAERAGKEGTIDSDILTRLSNENWYLPLRKR